MRVSVLTRLVRALAPGLLALTLLAVSAAPATAVEYGHTVITGEYGREGPKASGTANGCLLAYQNAEHRLYFMGNEKFYALHWNGPGSVTQVPGFPVQGPVNAYCYGAEPAFTVDQLTGNIYMANVYEPQLWGFNKNGAELAGFPISFEGGEVCGVATTSSGEVFAGHYSPPHIDRADSSGSALGSIPLPGGGICSIAVDQSNNDLYVMGYGGGTITKYSAASGYSATGLTFASSPNHNTEGFTVNGASHTLYVPYDETVRAYDTTTGELKESIEFGGETLGVAVDEATDTLFIDDQQNSVIKEMPKAAVPKAVTGDPVGNKKVSGVTDPNGAGNVVECFFEYGSAAGEYDLGSQACDQPTPYSAETQVTATLAGIPLEQTTHYRLVAKTASGGVRRGADKTITPHAVEGLTTEAATSITRKTAQLNASFEGNGEATEYKFQWGISGYEFESTLTSAGNPTAPPRTQLPLAIGSLHPETTYHFRVVAVNGHGTSNGNDRTFKTLPPVQSLSTEPATNVGPRTATLNGSFVGDGDGTSYYFKYGTTNGFYPNKTPVVGPVSPTGLTHIWANISGLELETTYHFRIVATNSLGTTETPDATFTSRPAVEGVLTQAATGISQEAITLHGQYQGNGHDIHYHFEYGLTESYGEETADTDAGTATGTQPASAVITDYLAYSTYHFRLVAEDTDPSVEGVTYGPDFTLETEPALLPGVSGTRIAAVTPTGAVMQAEVNPRRWLTVFRFDYGTDSRYGRSTEWLGPVGSDTTAHTVSAEVGGLVPGTLYHYRVAAINFRGTVYGPDMTFFTPGAPQIQSVSSDRASESGAHLAALVAPNAAATSVRFEYGTTASYGSSSPDVAAGSGIGTVDVGTDIGGLAPDTTYHFRAVASNANGTVTSSDQTFTTAPASAHESVKPGPGKCRHGFVRRHGKCVRKHRHHSHHRRHGHG